MSFFETILNRVGEILTGPLNFRFILQPLIAILLGLRDGRMDTRTGAPPYFMDFLLHAEKRRDLIANASVSVLKPIIAGITIDAIAQYLIFKTIHPLQAVIVGSFFIAVPYVTARGLTNRIISRKKKE